MRPSPRLSSRPRALAVLGLLALLPALVRSQEETVVASFQGQINYVWDENNVEADYLASGQYTPATNVITGIKVNAGVTSNPQAAEVFLAVPRWIGGVPSTLNRLTLDLTAQGGPIQDPPLEPFPSWEMQEVGNCTALQYVQSFEIDNDGNMWVIDNGSVDIFTGNRTDACPPKLLIIDTATGELVDEPYIFPEDVVPRSTGFLNDIAVSSIGGGLAYITDITENVGGNVGALITYQRSTRTSARFYDPTMAAGFSWTFMGRVAVALTPDGSRVLYSALQGVNTYSVDTLSLFTPGADWAATIVNHGARQGPTDGFTMDCAGRLFYSDLTSTSVYRWDDFDATSTANPPSDTGVLVAQDNDSTMWWTGTFGWDDDGYLWTTASFLPAVFVDQEFLQANIVRIPGGTGSYQSGACAAPPPTAAAVPAPTAAAPTAAAPTAAAPTAAAPTAAIALAIPNGNAQNVCIHSIKEYDAGYGNCATYSQDKRNHRFCAFDTNNDGVKAEDACPECEKCTVLKSCIHHIPEYDAGYGNCATYLQGEPNHHYCALDTNIDGVKADDACPECGRCKTGNPISDDEAFLIKADGEQLCWGVDEIFSGTPIILQQCNANQGKQRFKRIVHPVYKDTHMYHLHDRPNLFVIGSDLDTSRDGTQGKLFLIDLKNGIDDLISTPDEVTEFVWSTESNEKGKYYLGIRKGRNKSCFTLRGIPDSGGTCLLITTQLNSLPDKGTKVLPRTWAQIKASAYAPVKNWVYVRLHKNDST